MTKRSSRERTQGGEGELADAVPPGAARGPLLLGEDLRAWVVLAAGVLAVSAHSALSFGITPLMRAITADLGWTRSEYATAINFRILLLMAAAPLAGSVVDRFGARAVLALGALAMAAGGAVMAGADTLGDLYAASVLIGPAQACIGTVAGSALVLRRFRRQRGVAIGILNGGDNIITSGVHYGAAALLVVAGWRGALDVIALAYVLLALFFTFTLTSGEGRALRATSGEFHIPWRDRRFHALLACYVLVYAFITSVGLHFPAFQQDLGRSPTEAAAIYGTSNLVGALGSIAWGLWAQRFGAARTLLVVVAGLLLTSFVLWLPLPGWAFWPWAVVYGVVNAGAVALLALVLDEQHGVVGIGRLLGTAMVFCMGATIVGNQLSAAVFDATGSYLPIWRLYTGAMALALLPAWIVARGALRGREPAV